ncbi:MAG: Crp/Fnr family transcriptional regulator [Sulfurimonas sp.]|nr:Crp/Fnr family transcriptional regulator [Sulfurimonas sp.]MBU3940070.1 Crp/Fnr family transcriptional regulator [bacterium]MBU4025246.1 Crp/Fnr family transcriptional regulator [bacterium]MBU4059284.1 Crp/Fnr family transcriptional regulator [bacterium]MBU4109657.1 Crp/Fnr family transcriptional regulator [bacterium]
MIQYDNYVSVIANSPLFKDTSSEFKRMLFDSMEYKFLPKKTVIDEDDRLQWLHLVIGGRIKISQINLLTSKEYIVYLLNPGDVFDVLSFIDQKEHYALFEALEDTDVLRIDIVKARELLSVTPEFNKIFLPYLGRRMRFLEENASDLALFDTVTRLSKLILRNIDTEDAENDEIELINNLSQEDIAKMLGSVRTVISRNLQELKKNQILETDKGKHKVKDLNALIKQCEHALIPE